MRKKEGEEPIHVTMLWASKFDCGNMDVLFLIEFLDLKGRDCHVNTGVHGEVNDDGEFKFRWDKISEDFYRQDLLSAEPTTNNVSLHEITQKPFHRPIYHAGVDTIDGFCKSWYRNPTENELNIAYEDFCIQQEQEPTSGAAQGGSGEAKQHDAREEKLPGRTALEEEVSLKKEKDQPDEGAAWTEMRFRKAYPELIK